MAALVDAVCRILDGRVLSREELVAAVGEVLDRPDLEAQGWLQLCPARSNSLGLNRVHAGEWRQSSGQGLIEADPNVVLRQRPYVAGACKPQLAGGEASIQVASAEAASLTRPDAR
jgi:hypothetical protein